MIDKALKIDGWMSIEELRWLADRAKESKSIIEIGSWMGRSTRALGDNCPGVVYAIDLWAGFNGTLRHLPTTTEYEQFKQNLQDLIQDDKVWPFRMDSLDWTDEALALIQTPVDMVFLDGCHFEHHVLAEIQKYRFLVKSGGLLCGHDYRTAEHPGVTAAVDQTFPGVNHLHSIWWVRL